MANEPLVGKFRGSVVDNIDPLSRGRVSVQVPAVGIDSIWAMPCVPYAGPDVGMHFIPPIGANVWVEFEGGDPNHPIWVGCFWGEGQLPEQLTGRPEVKVIKTESNTLILDDTPKSGGIRATSKPPAIDRPDTTVITPN